MNPFISLKVGYQVTSVVQLLITLRQSRARSRTRSNSQRIQKYKMSNTELCVYGLWTVMHFLLCFTVANRTNRGPCCLQLQPLNISWTTVTEPALAASPAADQLQTRQTLLPGYFFPTARLVATSLIWSAHTVSLACCDHPHRSFCQFRHTTWTLLHVVSLLLLRDFGTLFHWTVELLHPLTHLRSVSRHFSLIRHNRTVARASVLWHDINWSIDWLIDWLI